MTSETGLKVGQILLVVSLWKKGEVSLTIPILQPSGALMKAVANYSMLKTIYVLLFSNWTLKGKVLRPAGINGRQ